MLALIASMPFESDLILSQMKKRRTRLIAGKTFSFGSLGGRKTLILNTGIGRVNAAHAATCAIENFPVDTIINLGVGGAYPASGLSVGDVAAASAEIYGDDGVATSRGIKGMQETGIPLLQRGRRRYFNEFPVRVPSLPGNQSRSPVKIRTGIFVTVSAASGTMKRAKELEKRFHAICENMEGAAIAQVSTIYNIPMIEIRGISNIAGIRDKRRWKLEDASVNCQKAVMNMLLL